MRAPLSLPSSRHSISIIGRRETLRDEERSIFCNAAYYYST